MRTKSNPFSFDLDDENEVNIWISKHRLHIKIIRSDGLPDEEISIPLGSGIPFYHMFGEALLEFNIC